MEETFREKGNSTRFHKGELVLYFDKAKAGRHDVKFEPKWKGPYHVVEQLQKGAYKLALDGVPIKGTVNGNLLKKYKTREAWEPVILI